MLVEAAAVADAPRYAPIDAAPSAGQLADLEQLLANAARPVAILGGSRWSEQAVQQFAAFAERHALPTSVSFRRQMLFPADHPATSATWAWASTRRCSSAWPTPT